MLVVCPLALELVCNSCVSGYSVDSKFVSVEAVVITGSVAFIIDVVIIYDIGDDVMAFFITFAAPVTIVELIGVSVIVVVDAVDVGKDTVVVMERVVVVVDNSIVVVVGTIMEIEVSVVVVVVVVVPVVVQFRSTIVDDEIKVSMEVVILAVVIPVVNVFHDIGIVVEISVVMIFDVVWVVPLTMLDEIVLSTEAVVIDVMMMDEDDDGILTVVLPRDVANFVRIGRVEMVVIGHDKLVIVLEAIVVEKNVAIGVDAVFEVSVLLVVIVVEVTVVNGVVLQEVTLAIVVQVSVMADANEFHNVEASVELVDGIVVVQLSV